MDPERTPAELGTEIARRRRDLGLSQEQLGAQAGVTKATIWNIEQGKYKRPSSLGSIAKVLGVTPETLTNYSESSQEPSGEGKYWNLLERLEAIKDEINRLQDETREQEEQDRRRRSA